jgi:hypothetical protein
MKKRASTLEKAVYGAALVLAAIVLFFAGRRTLLKPASLEPVARSEEPAAVSVPDSGGIRRSGTHEAVLDLPPLKVAGVGGKRRKAAAPPPPK